MAAVYILYSEQIGQFYIGSCKNLAGRISEHNNNKFARSFTRRANDWKLYYSMEDLTSKQAKQIENHIKRMKSKKYILNLKKYSEIGEKLYDKYK